jgi:hypothetical protein
MPGVTLGKMSLHVLEANIAVAVQTLTTANHDMTGGASGEPMAIAVTIYRMRVTPTRHNLVGHRIPPERAELLLLG